MKTSSPAERWRAREQYEDSLFLYVRTAQTHTHFSELPLDSLTQRL